MKDRLDRKTRLTAVDLKRRQRFAHLHSWNKVLHLFDSECLGPVYTKRHRQTLQQLCDDAIETVLIENNGVTWK